MTTIFRLICAAGMSMMLAQCMSTTATPVATTSNAATVSGAYGASEINAIRAANNRGALRGNAALIRAAQKHANDMGQNNFMSHTGSDGSTIRPRVERQGYRGCLVAENIGKGQNSLGEMLTWWMNSPGHRKNLLNPKYSDFGLAQGPGKSWVLVLGQPGC